MAVDGDELRNRFANRLQTVGGKMLCCSPREAIEPVLEAATAFPQKQIVYAARVDELLPDLVPALRNAEIECRPASSVGDALACPIALSAAEMAIAETGSVLLADRELAERAPSMLSEHNLIFVPDDRLVASLDHAGEWLRDHVRESPYVSFVTGPSRSADIERTLTVGVQGPRMVTVVFVRREPKDATGRRGV